MNITITVETNNALRGYSRSQMNQVYSVFYNKLGSSIIRFLKRYPRQRNPDSMYVRGFGVPPNSRTSEDLGSRWASTHSHNSVRILNNTSYSGYVQRAEFQAAIHQNWWQTDDDAIDQVLPAELDEFIEILGNL